MINILEYLKRRQKQRYMTDFPEDLNDVDAIVKWLDNKGFKQINRNDNEFRVGHPCYCIGPMSDSRDTHWIEISNGKDDYIVIRTVDNFSTPTFHKIGYYTATTMDKITVDEMMQYIEKLLKNI